MPTIADLNRKYQGMFEFEDANNGSIIRITALGARPYDGMGEASATYEIERRDHRNVALDDRSRWIELVDGDGKAIHRISYCGGMGLYQVVWGGSFHAFDDLPAEMQLQAAMTMRLCDMMIVTEIPELEELLLRPGQTTFSYKGRRQKQDVLHFIGSAI